MDFFTSFKICSSGLAAQRAKMDVVTGNIANVSTTKTPEGGAYKRKIITFASDPIKEDLSRESFRSKIKDALNAVKVKDVSESKEPMKTVYDPAHPDADKNGFVVMPNVNVVMEMTDMITAGRAYEANVAAFDATKSMALKTLDIGK
ncbi:MAG: Flagellar basal-body rod protein FlgC [Syntrophus sp. SKADARSKE-3]|nr:Flagellar basal-body rod protein FlgC [Syntrophus sp. SKADARSKE-3]